MRRRDFVLRSAQSAVAFGLLRQLGGCSPSTSPGSFAALREEYFLRSLASNPVTSTYLGGDGYHDSLAGINGRLRDWRPDALAQEKQSLRDTRAALKQFNEERFSDPERIDAQLLRAQIDFLLHQQDDRKYHQRAIDTYVAEPFRGVDWQIQQMQEAGDGLLGTEEQWNEIVSRLLAVPTYLAAAQANLLNGKKTGNLPDRRMVERDGIKGSTANADFFAKALLETSSKLLGNRPFASGVQGRLTQAGRGAAAAYSDFAQFLGTTYDLSERTDRFAAGKDDYEWRLANCLRETRPAADLYEYGATQVALYQTEMHRVAAKIAKTAKLKVAFGSAEAKGNALRAVMDHLSKQSPKNDDELFTWYREAGERAVAYGREQKLFDIPSDYQLEVVPTPPVLRSTIDAAYYPAPPLTEGGVGRFYLTPTGNDAAALKLNNRSSVADTAIHEGFPGHDWHYKYMTQHAEGISSIRWLTPGAVEDSSCMWQDSMATEGWALYSEELMAEPVAGRPYGFYTAAERLYELQGQLLRAARVRIDVGLHTGRMSYDQALDYYTENVEFAPGACAASDAAAKAICAGAQRAIYRYSKWPTQAITYNLGKNAIIDMRDALRKRMGDRFSAQEFHEGFMKMGPIPPGYFRSALLSG